MNVVIDTNVAVVASGRADHAPLDCMMEAISQIEKVKAGDNCLVIDSDGEIFQEYINNLSLSGQPGAGDAFIRWVNDHQYNPSIVDRVSIDRDENGEYIDFPNHPNLDNFDPSDRKFVAVANAHSENENEKPTILQATDCNWWGWRNALAERGIKVCFLCPCYVRETYEGHQGN